MRGGGNSKLGFTLAEVLVTLGIIGVVAVITLPTVINNIQDRQNIAKWKKMYSVISQAYLQTIEEGYMPCQKNEHGYTCVEDLTWTRNTSFDSEFVNQLMKKFNVVKYCGPETGGKIDYTCGPSYFITYKTLAGGKLASYNLSEGYYWLATGELIMIGGTHGGPWISVDVDGFGKGKDILGKDLFTIKAYDNYLRPMGAKNTFNQKEFGEECECSKDVGAKDSTYISNSQGDSVASGACCSAYYLLK